METNIKEPNGNNGVNGVNGVNGSSDASNTSDPSETNSQTNHQSQGQTIAIQKAKIHLRQMLLTHDGDTAHPKVKSAMEKLIDLGRLERELMRESRDTSLGESHQGRKNDQVGKESEEDQEKTPQKKKSSPWSPAQELELNTGRWRSTSTPPFPGRLPNEPSKNGNESTTKECRYTLGRMSFGMFQPGNLVCVVKDILNVVEPMERVVLDTMNEVEDNDECGGGGGGGSGGTSSRRESWSSWGIKSFSRRSSENSTRRGSCSSDVSSSCCPNWEQAYNFEVLMDILVPDSIYNDESTSASSSSEESKDGSDDKANNQPIERPTRLPAKLINYGICTPKSSTRLGVRFTGGTLQPMFDCTAFTSSSNADASDVSNNDLKKVQQVREIKESIDLWKRIFPVSDEDGKITSFHDNIPRQQSFFSNLSMNLQNAMITWMLGIESVDPADQSAQVEGLSSAQSKKQSVLKEWEKIIQQCSQSYTVKKPLWGYTDILYFDEEMRISRGNRGTYVVVERM